MERAVLVGHHTLTRSFAVIPVYSVSFSSTRPLDAQYHEERSCSPPRVSCNLTWHWLLLWHVGCTIHDHLDTKFVFVHDCSVNISSEINENDRNRKTNNAFCLKHEIASPHAVEVNKLMQNSIYQNLSVLKYFSTSLLGLQSKNTWLWIAFKTG